MKKVLIVDDDQDIRDSLIAILSSEFHISGASNKKDAVAILKSDMRPDILLLDVKMDSKQEGFELVSEIHEDVSISGIPIILVTSTEAMTFSSAAGDIARKLRTKYASQDLNVLILMIKA